MTPDWYADAACRGMDPEIFFPTTKRAADRAKSICAGCEVRTQCLADAIESEADGVRGGLTERERRRVAMGRWP